MSLDAQDWVWQHSQSKGTARLVLLAIADKANGADCSAYAGTTMLVKRSNAARSSVVVAVDKLTESGELEIVPGKKGPKGETVYRLPKARGHRRTPDEGGPKSGPVRKPDPSENRTPRGTESGPPRSENRTPTGPESGPHNAYERRETQENPEGARADAHEQHQPPAAPQQKGRPTFNTPIDDDGFELNDAMRRWATTHTPQLDVDYETAQFIDHHRGEGRRRKNWFAEWQKWMRRSAKWASERAQQQHGAVVPLHRPGAPRPSTTDARVQAAVDLGRQMQAEADAAAAAKEAQ